MERGMRGLSGSGGGHNLYSNKNIFTYLSGGNTQDGDKSDSCILDDGFTQVRRKRQRMNTGGKSSAYLSLQNDDLAPSEALSTEE